MTEQRYDHVTRNTVILVAVVIIVLLAIAVWPRDRHVSGAVHEHTTTPTTPAPVESGPSDAPTSPEAVDIGGDGTYLVGEDISAGTYTSDGGLNCHWVRLKSLSDDDEAVIDEGQSSGSVTVTIAHTDGAFVTTGCGTWTLTP